MPMITVWTSHGENNRNKCIFEREVSTIPRVGEYVRIKDGFGLEHIVSVAHMLDDNYCEITIATTDSEGNYEEI